MTRIRQNGGFVGKINNTTTSGASGIFGPNELQYRRLGGLWPNATAAAQISDEYFEYTTLLLPGNGTNGAQNNTFLDGSTNNFTITRNGNTTQGTFSPFSQTGWGNYFDGTGDYLSAGPNAILALGSGNFTVEAWIYPTTNTGQVIASSRTVPGTGLVFWLLSCESGQLTLQTRNSAGTQYFARSATGVINIGAWNHVAATRVGGVTSVYVNGVVGPTTVNDGSIDLTEQYIGVGIFNFTGYVSYYLGYISNFRLVKGTAVYTGNFTPPTAPLTAISGTSLLTCQSNRFKDNSTNNFTITKNGDTRVVAFSPFNPTASWSAATNGGSGYFDGSGDYLNTASDAAFTLGSSGDFTVEMFFYAPAAQATNAILISTQNNGSSDFVNRWGIQFATSTTLGWYNDAGSNGITSGTVVLSQWNHIAVCRSGSTIRMWLNGVSQGTQTTNQAYTTQGSVKVGFLIGLAAFSGYISNVRVVKGTAVYDASSSANITVPTAPLTAITNTSLLLNFTNAGVYDATSKNDLETVGNAQISTTQSKWGGSSMYFDGTGDYLTSNPATTDMYAFGSGDFTIEFWMYPNSLGGVIYDQRATGANAATPTFFIALSTLRYFVNNSSVIISSSLSTGQWYHVAVSRSGTSTKMFLNGTQTGSTYTDSTVYTNSSLRPFIGADSNNPGTNSFNGYIQDLRVTKGYARYTSNFTPPTAAFSPL